MEKTARIALVAETQGASLPRYTIQPDEVGNISRIGEWKLTGGSEGDEHLEMSAEAGASACDPGSIAIAAAMRVVHEWPVAA